MAEVRDTCLARCGGDGGLNACIWWLVEEARDRPRSLLDEEGGVGFGGPLVEVGDEHGDSVGLRFSRHTTLVPNGRFR